MVVERRAPTGRASRTSALALHPFHAKGAALTLASGAPPSRDVQARFGAYGSSPFSSIRIVKRSVCMRRTVAVCSRAIGRLEAM